MLEVNLDRFAEGFRDAQEGNVVVISSCKCGCDREIEPGYEHLNYDGEWFYDTECFLQYMGAVEMEAWADEQ